LQLLARLNQSEGSSNSNKIPQSNQPLSLQMATARLSDPTPPDSTFLNIEAAVSTRARAASKFKSVLPFHRLRSGSEESKNAEKPSRVHSLPSMPVSARGERQNRTPSSDLSALKSRLDMLVENDEQQRQQTRITRQELATSSEDAHLFDFVVVVKLQEGKKLSMEPYISYTFPPANVQKKQNLNLMTSIPSFCFPDIDIIQPVDTLESKTYSFVLTDVDGSRRHGYCRRMLPIGNGKRWPETYCIVSSQYVFCCLISSSIHSHIQCD
jgi:hypothetical protein